MWKYLLTFSFLSLACLCDQGQALRVDSNYAAPGRLEDIGGRRIHLICSGTGTPSIVLIPGGGAFSIDWSLVQSGIENTTRVCAYDRAGLGWSDSGPADETVEESISDLHAALHSAGEKGPFVLVGASIAGAYIQAYQHEYPGEVAGLVFSNSSNRIGFAGKNHSGLIWDLSEEDIKSVFPFPPSNNKREPATSLSDPFDRLPAKWRPVRLWLSNRLQEKWDTAQTGPESLLSIRKEFLREFDESDLHKNEFPLGKLPVIVVSSNVVANDSLRHSREGAAARLDFLSSNSLHIHASGSGHEIHLYQPDQVILALKIAVMAMRKSISLSKASDRR
ncbi:MAG: alpha/beta hydrolase [Chitinophagales bacterium]